MLPVNLNVSSLFSSDVSDDSSLLLEFTKTDICSGITSFQVSLMEN